MKRKLQQKVRESDVVKSVLEWLQWQGVFCWRNNSGNSFIQDKYGNTRMIKFGIAGSPDILCCLKGGLFCGLEAKGSGGQLTPDQLAFAKKVRDNGGIYLMVRSLNDCEEQLAKYLL